MATKRKPARRRRCPNPEATLNTLVILVVIVMVLGGLYLYAQNKKQASLWPSLIQTVSAFIAPAPATPPQIAQPAPTTAPIAPPAIATAAVPEITGSVQAPEIAASAKTRRLPVMAKPIQPAAQAPQPAIAVIQPSQDH